ncbi:MAG TPA: DUF3892 domain-containing protein [Solirubrobacterales bacterium]
MASLQIVAVRTERIEPDRHAHITAVKTSDGREWSRDAVLADIRSGADRFYTEIDGKRVSVMDVECPECNYGDYIRTKADQITADNLLSLPPF